MNFFPVSWNVEENNIRIYGIKEGALNGAPTCIQISNYPSRVVIELDNKRTWTSEIVAKCLSSIKQYLKGVVPKSCKRIKQRLLVGAFIESDGSPKLFDFLDLEYDSPAAAKNVEYFLSFIGVELGNGGRVKLRAHMAWIELWLQYALKHDLPICDWLQVIDPVPVPVDKKKTLCEFEYSVLPHNISQCKVVMSPPNIPIMAFDIEVYSSVPARFPEACVQEDKIFQISMIMGDVMKLITRGVVNVQALKDRFPTKTVLVEQVNSETALLEAMNETYLEFKPFLIIGYNNMNFDDPYIIARSKTFANCAKSMERRSMHVSKPAVERNLTWSSAACQEQNFTYMSGEGFQTLDLMPIIQKDYKLHSYKLDNVANHFLGTNKDDMKPQEMFAIYKKSIENPNDEESIEGMTRIGAYCLQDSQLVLDIFAALKLCQSQVALSTTTSCRIEDLSTRGAQYKVVSTILRFCNNEKIIVNRREKKVTVTKEKYRGATVFEPVKGVHEWAVSFDFGSLYPSLIIANNLCVSTLVDEKDNTIPDEKCIVTIWEDHVRCDHDERWIEVLALNAKCMELKKASSKDPALWAEYCSLQEQQSDIGKYNPGQRFCGKQKFRWYQGYVGVYPKILEHLLKKRASVRAVLKAKNGERIKGQVNILLENEIIALDSEQKAIKVVANSLYGFTGSATSPFACVAIAQTTTYLGRTAIEQASQIIRDEFGGFRIYGDTDSNYIKFGKKMDYATLYEYSKTVAKKVSDRFPTCLNIEFEGDIYEKYLIVNKKQYAYCVANPDGTTKPKIHAKGLLIVRRDGCEWVRTWYEQVIRFIFAKKPTTEIVQFLFEKSIELASHSNPDYIKLLAITKAVGGWGNGTVAVDSVGKTRMGKYIVPKLPDVEEERNKILFNKGFVNENEFYSAALPAHVQLAQRINKRGDSLIVPGERIAYLITGKDSFGAPMTKRLESIEWFRSHADILNCDFMHYINTLAIAVDKILEVVDVDRLRNPVSNIASLPNSLGYNIQECKLANCNCYNDHRQFASPYDHCKYYCKHVPLTTPQTKAYKNCMYCKQSLGVLLKKLFLQYRTESRAGHCASYVFQLVRKNKMVAELQRVFMPKFCRE